MPAHIFFITANRKEPSQEIFWEGRFEEEPPASQENSEAYILELESGPITAAQMLTL